MSMIHGFRGVAVPEAEAYLQRKGFNPLSLSDKAALSKAASWPESAKPGHAGHCKQRPHGGWRFQGNLCPGSCWPLQTACARWMEVSGQSLSHVRCRARPWQASPQHLGSTGSSEWSSLHTVSLFLSPSIHTHSPTTHTHIHVVTAPLHWQVSHGQEGHRHVWLRHLVRCHWVGVRTLPCCMRLFVPLCSTHSPCSLAGAHQHPEKLLT